MHSSTLFLTLKVFSATGGIEKVSRIAGKALYELKMDPGGKVSIFSMYDEGHEVDVKYFPASTFSGFGKNKMNFVFSSIRQGIKSKVVLLSHINLLLVGVIIKLLSPKTKLILLGHGIEVWTPFPSWKRYMLRKCDKILAVSSFTKKTMIRQNGLPLRMISVLNNCLDPFLPAPIGGKKSPALLTRYGLRETDIVLMTLTRLSAREKYKGYDSVLQSIKDLVKEYPSIRYLIVGKYDELEKERIDALIQELELQSYIVFAGFIPDDELSAHYNLADIYIMPSKKEGFGIVFIEALYYGKRVIAGNKDGTVDALCNGQFGLLVDPDNQVEITGAIKKMLENKESYQPDHELLMQKFSYEVYKNNLLQILRNLFK